MNADNFWKDIEGFGNAILELLSDELPRVAINDFWRKATRAFPTMYFCAAAGRIEFFCFEFARLVHQALLPHLDESEWYRVAAVVDFVLEHAHLIRPQATVSSLITEFVRRSQLEAGEAALTALMMECWMCADNRGKSLALVVD